jgi:hypothetical protein
MPSWQVPSLWCLSLVTDSRVSLDWLQLAARELLDGRSFVVDSKDVQGGLRL